VECDAALRLWFERLLHNKPASFDDTRVVVVYFDQRLGAAAGTLSMQVVEKHPFFWPSN
jgi:hypothetical protein